MARAITPQDVYSVVNLIVKEVTGQDAQIQTVDSSNFVSVGETLLSSGMENVLNAISIVAGRLLVASRPYDAKLNILRAEDTGVYTHRMRKISYYSREALPDGAFNTNLYTNLADGYDNGSNSGNSVASMWEQNAPVPLEMNFAGSSVWDDSTTVYKYQLKQAFRSEDEFARFWAGVMTEKRNDMNRQKEAFQRMALLSRIVGQYAADTNAPGSVINLTAEFNDRFGTSYTSAQLRTTYLKEFLAFFVEKYKEVSKKLTYSTTNYHWAPEKPGYALLRHTPADTQRAILYAPLFRAAEAQVLPEIFHEGYLKVKNYEDVEFWQNFNEPEQVKGKTAIPDFAGTHDGEQQATDVITIPYVVGCIFDRDALMVDYQLDDAETTPMEARKKYYNLWWNFARNVISDYTENFVIFIMEDE